jgi:hypothetical protein
LDDFLLAELMQFIVEDNLMCLLLARTLLGLTLRHNKGVQVIKRDLGTLNLGADTGIVPGPRWKTQSWMRGARANKQINK